MIFQFNKKQTQAHTACEFQHRNEKAMKKLIWGLLCCCAGSVSYANNEVHWGYQGEVSAEHWGALSDQYQLCATGKNQSPINIQGTYHSTDQHPIQIDYAENPENIVFNGHTVQVNAKNSQNNKVTIDGENYYLKQFHFHTPSENTIDGKQFPLEIHFVNANAQGQLTVLAVMVENGQANPEWTKLWKDFKAQENQTKPITSQIQLQNLLPTTREYYRFSGSLTTPPCSEGVNWIVYKNPITMSQDQIQMLQKVLNFQHNNRPVQVQNGRIIIED